MCHIKWNQCANDLAFIFNHFKNFTLYQDHIPYTFHQGLKLAKLASLYGF